MSGTVHIALPDMPFVSYGFNWWADLFACMYVTKALLVGHHLTLS